MRETKTIRRTTGVDGKTIVEPVKTNPRLRSNINFNQLVETGKAIAMNELIRYEQISSTKGMDKEETANYRMVMSAVADIKKVDTAEDKELDLEGMSEEKIAELIVDMLPEDKIKEILAKKGVKNEDK